MYRIKLGENVKAKYYVNYAETKEQKWGQGSREQGKEKWKTIFLTENQILMHEKKNRALQIQGLNALLFHNFKAYTWFSYLYTL